MGQKVNPIGLRLSLNKKWQSKWFANKQDFGKFLQEDIKIRNFLNSSLKKCGVAKIEIERPAKKPQITIFTARPGLIIGKKGSDIEKLKKKISSFTGQDVSINLVEIRKPEVEAQLIADNIAEQLERRVSFSASTLTGRLDWKTKSIMETLGVGTRTDRPLSLPANWGNTNPTANAAPVVVGTMFCAAARARRKSLWGASSNR